MLLVTIPAGELFNDETNEFIKIHEQTISLEHSLVSASKWESIWHKPYLSETPKTTEEILSYLQCMTLTKNVNPFVYLNLKQEQIQQIKDYISNPMTATTFHEPLNAAPKRKQIITTEIIYYQMFQYNIPMECQKWHLNRLLTLIRVCAIKSEPEKKMSQRDIMRQYSSLNNSRRAALHSKG